MLKKTITLILLYALTFAFIKVVWEHYTMAWVRHEAFYYFVGSTVVGVFLCRRLIRKTPFYTTLRHELCHWFFALLSFNRPHSLNINGDGSGSYQHFGRHNYGIVLAPYFFPLLTVLLLLLQVFFSKPAIPYFILLGIAMAFDLASMQRDYHPHQSDWHRYGMLFSIQFSVLMLLLLIVSICVVLFGGFGAYPIFLKSVFLFFKHLNI